MFSAYWRHTVQVRNMASPSFHSPAWRSKVRGVDATRKLATATPLAVKRSSGSSTRLPTSVIWVSPAMSVLLDVVVGHGLVWVVAEGAVPSGAVGVVDAPADEVCEFGVAVGSAHHQVVGDL